MSQGTPESLGAHAPSGAPRWLPFLALLLVAAVFVPWQGASLDRLASLSLADLIAASVEVDAVDEAGHAQVDEAGKPVKVDRPSPAALAILASRHVVIDDEKSAVVLTLGDLSFTIDGSPASVDAVVSARRSLLQGLRQFAESGFEHAGRSFNGDSGSKYSLNVVGERDAVASGLDVRVRLGAADASGQRQIEIEPLVADGVASAANPIASAPWQAPTRFSLLPPVVAIALAIATRKPLLSLFCGVLIGAVLVALRGGASTLAAIGQGAFDVPTVYFWNRFASESEIFIILFVVFMLAMVGNTVRNGGIAGIMNALAKKARDARSTQIATWLMGLAVFFDDYANTVLVGSTMRPLCDRYKVSREKLAYLVDSTAAPVAGISIFSTWIAFEVSTFAAQLPAAGLATSDGYAVFVQTLPYRFYCIFTLIFLALIAFSNRDFGPMRKAEHRARTTGAVLRPGATPLVSSASTEQDMADGAVPNAWNAIIPIGGFIITTLLMIAYGGGAFAVDYSVVHSFEDLVRVVTQVLYDGSGNEPLMIGGAFGFALAALATIRAGLAREVLPAAWTTLRSMGVAFGILYSAWMVADVCTALGTAQFLLAIVSDAISAPLLPVALILLSGVVAFSTGSSWSTMGILLPMVIGVAYQLGEASDIGGMALVILCIGSVLEGAIFGDHCSPISDTTVLSSISSASDHIDHVRTQMPYALTAMGVAIGAGYIPAAFLGWSPFLCIGFGVVVMVAIVFIIGKRNEPAIT